MTDPKISPSQLTEHLSSVVGQLESIVKRTFTEAYRLGYAHGDRDAIARILHAARPAADGLVARNHEKIEETNTNRMPGADTHKLIAIVLREIGTATPMEIFKSLANTEGISRQAIGKVLRRGVRTGRYIDRGWGRYALGKSEGNK